MRGATARDRQQIAILSMRARATRPVLGGWPLGVSGRSRGGGIFVLFAIENPCGFIIAIVAGMIVGAAAVIALKEFTRKPAVAR